METKSKSDEQITVTLELKAQNLAFEPHQLRAPRSAHVVINMHNLDSGTAHNFSLYEDGRFTRRLFQGEVISGTGDIGYEFAAPDKPGKYFFGCDIHPMQKMSGDFIVD